MATQLTQLSRYYLDISGLARRYHPKPASERELFFQSIASLQYSFAVIS